jgi:hypothetical protein
MTAPSSVHFSGDGVERGLRIVGVATVILTAFTVVLAIIAIPLILGTAENAEEANSVGTVIACRSEARAIVDDAISTALATNSDLLTTISRLSEATAMRDTDMALSLSAEAEANRLALATATTELIDATRVYNDAIRLSISSPEEFVRNCEG